MRHTEFQEAARVWSGNLGLHLNQFPSGKWGFVGSVPRELCYVAIDGSTATDEQLRNAAQFGPRLAGVKTRVWDTRESAVQAAQALGCGVIGS